MLPEKLESEDLSTYALRLDHLAQSLAFTNSETSPMKGGCWYCWSKVPQPESFSHEFDTFLHLECLRRWRVGHPGDSEAHIFATEFGVTDDRRTAESGAN